MARKRQDKPESIPTASQKRRCWQALTLLAFTVIGFLVVGHIWLATRILSFLQPLLVPLAAAGIMAYLLYPLVKRLEANGTPSKRAVYVVFLGFIAAMGILALSVAPAFKDLIEHRGVVAERAETGISNFFNKLNSEEGFFAHPRVKPMVESISEAVRDPANWEWLKQQGPALLSHLWILAGKGMGFLGYVIGLFLVPIYLFFFLREAQVIQKNWTNYVPLRASKIKDEVVGVLDEINGYLIAFFRGQLLVSMIDGLLVGLCLLVIGLPYAIPIGVFVALLGVIPYIGNLMCLIPAVIISMAHFAISENQFWGIEQVWVYPIIVISIFFVTQQLNSLVTAPKIVGDSVGLHPLTVIFSVLFWTLLIGGFLGSLLAIPLTASVKVLFRRYIWEMKFQREIELEQEEQEADEDEPPPPPPATKAQTPPATKAKTVPKKKAK